MPACTKIKTAVGTFSIELEDEIQLAKAKHQLDEYLAGERKSFDLPLDPPGTAFQKKVWRQLKKIPFGKTMTYGQVAKAIGHPKAYRAVGGACNANPLPILIPCHRVVGSSGSLTGYALGIAMKLKLLKLENINHS